MTGSSVLPARHGTAVPLAAGERLQIINREGGQVVDWWALAHPSDGEDEYASMEHTKLFIATRIRAQRATSWAPPTCTCF